MTDMALLGDIILYVDVVKRDVALARISGAAQSR